MFDWRELRPIVLIGLFMFGFMLATLYFSVWSRTQVVPEGIVDLPSSYTTPYPALQPSVNPTLIITPPLYSVFAPVPLPHYPTPGSNRYAPCVPQTCAALLNPRQPAYL